MKTKLLMVSAAAIVVLSFSVSASADRGPGDNPGNGRGKKNPSCVAGCVQTNKACRRAAWVQLRLCSASTCGDQIAAVRQDCEDNESSDACEAAVQELKTCMEPCLDAFSTATQACRTDARECVPQCPNRQPQPQPGAKDPACVAACGADLTTCLTGARTGAGTCRDGCSGLVDLAQQTCAENRRSQACQDARQAVFTCLSPCEDTLRQAIGNCISDANTCVGACPTPSATPVPSPSPSPGD